MNNSREYGYARVSSKGQNLQRQLSKLLEQGIEERFIFTDKESGKSYNRNQYQILRNALREGDTLYITSLDRLGRNYEETKEEWRYITKEIKADIVVLDMEFLDTRKYKDLIGSFTSDLVLSVLSYNANQEREHIKENQKQGILTAKANGVKFGRPKIEKPKEFDLIISRWKNGEITARESMKLLNLKPNTFYNMVKSEV